MTLAVNSKVILITGAARRIGAAIARTLHAQGMRIILHYHTSQVAATQLITELNNQRADSAIALQADLLQIQQLPLLIQQAAARWQRLDGLINNASTFYPTPLGSVSQAQWNDLFGTNLQAPLFLAQAAIPLLAKTQGCIINIIDIHAELPRAAYTVYCAAKAGLAMLTKTLAKELGPAIRVNGIAPGSILWPENQELAISENKQAALLTHTALQRQGTPEDIAKAAAFLLNDAPYVTGQILAVDGGRSLYG